MPFPTFGKLHGLLAAALLTAAPLVAAGPVLTLEDAEQLALQDEPTVGRYQELAAARQESAVSAGAFPDPMLITELMDVPADRPRLDEDPMTQLRVGVRQAFPRGQTRALSRSREELRAAAEHARADAAERATLNGVRAAYLELHYRRQAVAVLEDNRRHFQDLLEVAEWEFASGRVSRQDVIQAELELDRLEDRLSAARAEAAAATADLARWVGPRAADRPLPEAIPEISSANGEAIDAHPLLVAEDMTVTAGQRSIELARQGYRPEWSLEVTYGRATASGEDNPDRLSAMVMLDLPLFTRNRQDRDVAASRRERHAAEYAREEQHRALQQGLASTQARWYRLREREARFRERLLAAAEENAEAAEEAYRAGMIEFTALMRARITHLDTHLDAARVSTDRRLAQAQLLYLLGENQP